MVRNDFGHKCPSPANTPTSITQRRAVANKVRRAPAIVRIPGMQSGDKHWLDWALIVSRLRQSAPCYWGQRIGSRPVPNTTIGINLVAEGFHGKAAITWFCPITSSLKPTSMEKPPASWRRSPTDSSPRKRSSHYRADHRAHGSPHSPGRAQLGWIRIRLPSRSTASRRSRSPSRGTAFRRCNPRPRCLPTECAAIRR